MKNKLKIIIPIAVAVVVIIVAALCIDFTPAEKVDIPSLVSTAQKYLIENNYEQAIAEFNKIIEIDPMNVDAYIGIAEAYEKIGDIEQAIEWLEKGFEITGDSRIKAMLDMFLELRGYNVAESTSDVETNVKYVIVDGYRIPTNIEYLWLMGPDKENPEFSISTNEEEYEYRLSKPLNDISFISEFTNLTHLALFNNEISDLEPLSGLINLTNLYIDKDQISDISPLSGLTNLTFLSLGYNQISDISPISKLTNLTDLSLPNNQISDISSVSGLTNLTYLCLGDNQISDISSISNLTNLNELYLYDNQISDISPVSELTNLTYLSLWNNNISDTDREKIQKSFPNCDVIF